MTAEHVQWCIGLASVFVIAPVVYWLARRYQRSHNLMCPLCQRVYDDKIDFDNHFRMRHLRGPRT